MSASRNDAAAANSQGASGEFHSSRPRDEPLTTHGHQPGRITSEADAAPEFNAQTVPAGSAPSDRTFQPNNISEVEGPGATGGQTRTAASETLGGATSGEVHTGLGHPGAGQSSSEQRHDGKSHSKKEHGGLEGTGASGVIPRDQVDAQNPRFADQRGLGKEEVKGAGKGLMGGAGAHELPNETATGTSAGSDRAH